MIRLVKMSSGWYGKEIGEYIAVSEVVDIEEFVNAGESVLLCYNLAEAEDILDTDNIEMVE